MTKVREDSSIVHLDDGEEVGAIADGATSVSRSTAKMARVQSGRGILNIEQSCCPESIKVNLDVFQDSQRLNNVCNQFKDYPIYAFFKTSESLTVLW